MRLALTNTYFRNLWTSYNELTLINTEQSILKHIKTLYYQKFITLPNGYEINTIIVPSIEGERYPPLVLLHGYAGAIGHWVENLSDLAKYQKVIAFDIVGFGRSSRPSVDKINTVEIAEEWFISTIEEWRKQMKLDRFNILGHSLGGYLAGIYALAHPNRIDKLILASPAGIPTDTEKEKNRRKLLYESSFLRKTFLGFIHTLFYTGITPQSLIRGLGPIGRNLVHKAANARFSFLMKTPAFATFPEYLHQTVVHQGSSERLIAVMFHPLIVPKIPLGDRLKALDKNTLFLYGQYDWMPVDAGHEVRRHNKKVNLEIVPNAGHQLFLENPPAFNRIVTDWIERTL